MAFKNVGTFDLGRAASGAARGGNAVSYTHLLYDASEEGDIFILAIGDKDYVPVVETIERKGRVCKIAFWGNVAGELVAAASEYLNLDDHLDEISH